MKERQTQLLDIKDALRKRLLSLADIEYEPGAKNDQKNADMLGRLIYLHEYQASGSVFTFVSKKGEPDTVAFIRRALADGKTVSVPICLSEGHMEARRILSLDDLSRGTFGILEPGEHCRPVNAGDIDFALVPGIAFSVDGKRLGRGGGYYDRFLEAFEGFACGYSRESFVFYNLPTGFHDRRVDALITEKKVYRFL